MLSEWFGRCCQPAESIDVISRHRCLHPWTSRGGLSDSRVAEGVRDSASGKSVAVLSV